MRAIVHDVYGPPEVLELRDVPKPDIGDDEVLVRVRAAGVDPGVWHLMTGLPYLVRVMGYGLRAPKAPIPGTDVAGLVEEVGAHVTRFQAGDEVFGTCVGAFAEYAAVREDRCEQKPERLTFEQAAAVPVSGMAALQALRDKGQVQADQDLLVVGAGGGVGTYAVQIAKAFGAWVTGVCSTAKMDVVRAIGADDVIDYTRDDPFDGTRTYDVILDMAGNRRLATLRRGLARRGTLVIVGGEDGGRWLGGIDRMLRALLMSPFVSQHLLGLMAAERGEDLRVLAALIEAGKVTPVIDRTYPLAKAPGAIRYLHERRVRGKLVITL